MRFVTSFLLRNPNYKKAVGFCPTGITLMTIHKAQPSAKVLMNNQNHEKCFAICPHAIIDHTGTAYNTLPWNVKGPHSMDHIVILLCEPGEIKYNNNGECEVLNADRAMIVEQRIYDSAVELCAQVCVQNNFDPTTAITTPYDTANVEEIWKVVGLGKTLIDFLGEVRTAVERIQKKVTTNAEPSRDSKPELIASQKEEETSVSPTFLIRVDVDRLRIRSAPKASPDTVTGKYTGKGTFTIVEVQNGSGSTSGWGRLETGGWISLDHVVRL